MNSQKPDVAIVGLGYVGFTLAVALAQVGLKVWGYERQSEVVHQLNRGRAHLFELGLEEGLQTHLGGNLVVEDHLPSTSPEFVILCVSTPVGSGNVPDLRNLESAAQAVAENINDSATVIVRSTVPVGTSRKVVLPALRSKYSNVYLAACPERTIQGKALEELRLLPQVVGGLDDASQQRATRLWEQVSQRVVPVSSLEAAEMVKLINNCHTDLLYSFGNEVAMMAGQLQLDPTEVIGAANLDYPRPDLARPGFVAGPCLTKDSYLLINSFDNSGYAPQLVEAARRTNEDLPITVANHFIEGLQQMPGGLDGASVLVCGFAYKGWPVTDDVRGSSTGPIMDVLRQFPITVYGHDHNVRAETISAMGAIPVPDLAQGCAGVSGILFVNEHPEYRGLKIEELTQRMKRPSLIYDCWRMFDSKAVGSLTDVHYRGIGFG